MKTRSVVLACLEANAPPTERAQASEAMAAGLADWRLAKPPADEFFVTDEVWEQLCYVVNRGKNVLLTGPSGCGKSELCYRVAEAAGRAIEPFNCGAMSEPRSSLIGNTHFDREKGTWFAESRFVRAVQKKGTCLLLDEISRSGRDAFNILLPLLDAQGYLAIDEAEGAPVVKRAESVMFFATANLGMEYTGAEPLDKALADRFPVVIAIDFPPLDQEFALLSWRCPGPEQSSRQTACRGCNTPTRADGRGRVYRPDLDSVAAGGRRASWRGNAHREGAEILRPESLLCRWRRRQRARKAPADHPENHELNRTCLRAVGARPIATLLAIYVVSTRRALFPELGEWTTTRNGLTIGSQPLSWPISA